MKENNRPGSLPGSRSGSRPDRKSFEEEGRLIYNLISAHEGVTAREIAKELGLDKTFVNQALYTYPFIRELCVRDDDYKWYALIRQACPHEGLGEFCGWYGTVPEFLETDEERFMKELTEGCSRIGRNLNDTRGLFHSFRDTYETMRALFDDLADFKTPAENEDIAAAPNKASRAASTAETGAASQAGRAVIPAPAEDSFREKIRNWEIAFELRINRSRCYIRIYADVLLITPDYVFSLEFKMKDRIEEEEVKQAAKYVPYLEILFGPDVNVVPALVLTKGADLYTYTELPGTTAEVPVCSGDMLFNLFDEYLRIL